MASLNPESALFGSKNLSARTDNVFFPIDEVSTSTITKGILLLQKVPILHVMTSSFHCGI